MGVHAALAEQQQLVAWDPSPGVVHGGVHGAAPEGGPLRLRLVRMNAFIG